MKKLKRFVSVLLVVMMMTTTFIPMFGSLNPMVSAYNTNYPNTHTNTGNQRADIVAVAQTQVGYYGPGDDNKYGASFNHNGVSWCAYFIVWCARQAGIGEDIIKTSGIASPFSSYLNVPTRLRSSGYQPSPGDLIFFDYDRMNNHDSHDHIAIVEYYNSSTGIVTYINGNTTNDYVARSTISYNHADICCYGIPNYEGSAPIVDIREGVYVFHCVRNTDRVLDIQYDSKERGANIQLYDALYNQEQKFRVVNMGDYYCIQSVYSGMWLDIANKDGSYSVDGCNIQLWDTNTSTEQKWVFEDAGDGNYYIHSLYGMYLDTGGPTDNNTNIQTYHFDGTTSQQWKLEWTSPYERIEIPNGTYTFHNVRNPARVMDTQYDSTENQANIQLYDDLNNSVQRFYITKENNYYLIQSAYSGLWLDIASPFTTSGCNIQLWQGHSNPEEKWIFEDAGDGKTLIRSLYGTYVDLENGQTANNTNIQSFDYDGSTSMEWVLHQVYSVSYNANGGTGAPATQGKQSNIDLTISSVTPTRDGYTFVDWNTRPDALGYGYAPGGVYRGNADLTLYANWRASTFTVTYDANGGIGAPAAQTKQYGVDLKLRTETPTREGYTFVDWNTRPDALGYGFAPGGTYKENANLTLYAYWKVATYTVTYDANGGIGAPAAQTKQHGVDLALRTTVPTRTGYIFVNWNTRSDGFGFEFAPGETYSGNADLSLYAYWTAAAYTVTLDPDGGTCGIPAITAYCNEPYGVLPVPERDGFVFDGWFLGETLVTESTVCTTADDHTLTAHWTAIEMPVTVVPKEDSTAVIDDTCGFIYGLDFGLTADDVTNDFLGVTGNGRLEYDTVSVGTGTVVSVIDNDTGETIATYVVVIFGDLDGDGMIGSSDFTQMRAVSAQMVELPAGSAKALAADINHDGLVNSTDYTDIRSASAQMLTIRQSI